MWVGYFVFTTEWNCGYGQHGTLSTPVKFYVGYSTDSKCRSNTRLQSEPARGLWEPAASFVVLWDNWLALLEAPKATNNGFFLVTESYFFVVAEKNSFYIYLHAFNLKWLKGTYILGINLKVSYDSKLMVPMFSNGNMCLIMNSMKSFHCFFCLLHF